MAEYRIGQQQIQPDESGNVQLKGFLYRTKEGAWVLSQEPQLKSCCVGAREKVMEQVFLDGDFDFAAYSPATVVDVSGIFKVSPVYAESGAVLQYYQLQNAALNQRASESGFFSLAWVGVVLLLGFMGWRFRRA